MVFINVLLFFKRPFFIILLIILSHLLLVFTFYTTQLIVKFFFLFFIYTLLIHFRNAAAQPHRPFNVLHFSFLSFKTTVLLFWDFFCSPLFLCRHWRLHEWTVYLLYFWQTNRADILPWTSAPAALYLHWFTVAVQVKTLTPNCESLLCITPV